MGQIGEPLEDLVNKGLTDEAAEDGLIIETTPVIADNVVEVPEAVTDEPKKEGK